MTIMARPVALTNNLRVRKLLTPILLAAFVAACTPTREATVPSETVAQPITLSVIGTNDFHGALVGSDSVGGVDLLGGYLNNLRALRESDGGGVLLIDAGDMWQGTLESNMSEGASVVAAFNALGYTAAAFGNHEFDYGPVGPKAIPEDEGDDPQGVMKARATEANFPMLAANLIDLETGVAVDWPNVQPTVMVDVAGVRVGIIGVMTENAFSVTILANTSGLLVRPIAETVVEHARQLREDGATIVIVTAHAGSRYEAFDDPYDLTSCFTEGEIFRVANALPEGLVDMIIGGHAHEGIAHFVNGIAVTSAFSRGVAFDRVDFLVDAGNDTVISRNVYPPQFLCRYLSVSPGRCAVQEHDDVPLAAANYAGKPVEPDAAVAESIRPAVEQAGKLKVQPLGIRLATEIRRGATPESPIGNLMTTALLESAGADFAIHNTRGGIRADLPAGDMTYGSLYEMFPFDNRMVTIQMSGGEFRRMFESQMRSGFWRAGFGGGTVSARCTVSGLKIDIARPSGDLVEYDDELQVVTSDFLLLGGDGIFSEVTPKDGFTIPDDSPYIRDVLEEWFKNRGGTISADTFYDADNPRFVLETRPPIRCD